MRYNENLKRELLRLLLRKSVITGNITLSSGKKSSYYIDVKMTSLDRDGVVLCARLFASQLKGISGIGGPTLGADPFLGAILYECRQRKKNIYGFMVRKKSKTHGTTKLIEGPIREKTKVALIEDVITTGHSVYEAVKTVEKAGVQVVKILSVVDREEGGSRLLKKKGYPVYPIFTKSDLGLGTC